MNSNIQSLIQSLINQIVELRNQAQPILNQIELLQKELNIIKRNQENVVLANNRETVEFFERNGAKYIFADVEADVNRNSVSEDDGNLHVSIGQVRGCFICNQELTRREWNAEARQVLQNLGIPFSRLNQN